MHGLQVPPDLRGSFESMCASCPISTLKIISALASAIFCLSRPLQLRRELHQDLRLRLSVSIYLNLDDISPEPQTCELGLHHHAPFRKVSDR